MSKRSTESGESDQSKKVRSSSSSLSPNDSFVPPSDWPGAGPIDLTIQDLPHASAATEWWYANGHLNSIATPTSPSRAFSYFASFFRMQTGTDSTTHAPIYSSALTWAIVDLSTGEYYADPILDRTTPSTLKHQLESGHYSIDKLLRSAFLEVVNKNQVPLPDRVFESEVTAGKGANGELELNFGGNTFVRVAGSGEYLLHCENKERSLALTLKLVPQRKVIRQAHEGVVQIGLKQETMFYYFIPRLAATGTITVPKVLSRIGDGAKPVIDKNGEVFQVEGTGWYDHEFGGALSNKSTSTGSNGTTNGTEGLVEMKHNSDSGSKSNYAWNWVSLQLSNGVDITATNLADPTTGEVLDNFAITVSPTSDRNEYSEMSLTALNSWVSIKTTHDYPTQWHFVVPGAQIDLKLSAAFDSQEFVTLIAKPAFWEGRMHVTGRIGGQEVTGVGFIERHGFTTTPTLDTFFKRISKQVLEVVDGVLPLKPTYEEARLLVASAKFDHLMRGVDLDVYAKTIIHPLREIIDRGGKSWRSFACLLCVDAVGGDSNCYRHWLAMPEIMHVGSLIIDDIQDKSETRRGGQACHKKHGDAIAINAGSAAYFIALNVLQDKTPNMSIQIKNLIYELYFLTLRAGHAGQAFDIYGLSHHMKAAIETGNAKPIIDSIQCTHTLKSAVPAGCLARIGATIGGGSETQIVNMGRYFESVGLAFQIMDDVINLRGFDKNSKTRGEDITAGKITYPIAMAMDQARIKTKQDRQSVWDRLQSKPDPLGWEKKRKEAEEELNELQQEFIQRKQKGGELLITDTEIAEHERKLIAIRDRIATATANEKTERAVLDGLIEDLEKWGAITASSDAAKNLVQEAWEALDSSLPDSYYKMMLRAFGQFVLKQYY